MSSTVNVNINNPSPIDIVSTMGGSLDVGLDNIQVKALPTIVTDSTLTMKSNLSIDNIPQINIGVTQLPEIKLQFGMKPTRVHFPTNMKFAFCALGQELFSFGICGESMVVVEDYVAHRREECR